MALVTVVERVQSLAWELLSACRRHRQNKQTKNVYNYFVVLEVNSPKCVCGTKLLSGGSKNESVSWIFLASRGCRVP